MKAVFLFRSNLLVSRYFLAKFENLVVKFRNQLANLYKVLAKLRESVDICWTPLDYYKEIINNYRQITYELDFGLVEDYAALFKNGSSLMDMIQMEVL